MPKMVFLYLNTMCQEAEVYPQMPGNCNMFDVLCFQPFHFPTKLIILLTPLKKKILFLLKIAVVLIPLTAFC